MIKNLIKAKNFLVAMSMLRQIEFALFDIKIHKKPYSKQDIQKILDSVRKRTSIIKPPKYNKFQCSFTHIFAGGYASGYYSYKWAEVLSSDAFYKFKKDGIFNKKTAQSFLKNVLQSGGSKSMRENFKTFMKREPKIEALLRISKIR
jgi:oligopeptidase A